MYFMSLFFSIILKFEYIKRFSSIMSFSVLKVYTDLQSL